MHGSGRSQGWLIHLMAGAALGAVVVLVIWIFTGGRPFGELVGTGDVSAPTRQAAVATPGASTAAAPALKARPPALKGSSSGTIRFLQPGAKRRAKAERAAKAKARAKAKDKARARAKRKRRGSVVRVVAPPAEHPPGETPVAVVPSPAPTSAPAPAAPPAGGGGGEAAKPKSPGPTLWAGEG